MAERPPAFSGSRQYFQVASSAIRLPEKQIASSLNGLEGRREAKSQSRPPRRKAPEAASLRV
ncbi:MULTISPECIES: hypothetical protein [Eikenella]|uniref:hypothetical protein n=1 Tax=Eikenella TaxID=538 RepID=UPI000AA2E67E|nr:MULTISPECIES: hypothetical protein [Eikenella]